MTGFILTAALLASQLFSPDLTVTGRVTDNYLRGIRSAQVRICADVECLEPRTAYTNSFGYFRLTVPEGFYTVEIKAKGFEDGLGLIGPDSYRGQVYILDRR